jgi:RNA polymerase primary sigma factor
MTADDDHPLDHSESRALAADAARGRRADRDLAARLEHPAPDVRAVSAHRLDDLAARRGELGRALLEAAQAGDEDALMALVEAYLPRIAALSRRYAGDRHVERLELIQEGVAGLLQALQRFDASRGASFWTYARPTVQRAMQRLVAELSDAAVLSDHALRRLSRVRDAEDELMRQQHRLPSAREIADRAGVDADETARLFAAAGRPRSLQEPIMAEDGGVIGSLGDMVDDPRAEDSYDRVLDALEAQELQPLLSVLSARERRVLSARYGLDGEERSIPEIAEQLGLSTSRVRDIEKRALSKLRRAAAAVDAAR